jgi:glyoxylase I family protein
MEPPPHIERYDHVAIYVTDLVRADTFYGGVLGLRQVPRPESFDFPGLWYHFGNNTLHLLVERECQPEHGRHFCLWVADVYSAARRVKQMGCEMLWNSRHKIVGIDRFFTRDPDGNRIEIQGSDAVEGDKGV